MNVSATGKVTLDKGEATRMKETEYIIRRLAREMGKESEKQTRLLQAADVIAITVNEFGGKHLDADGMIKAPVERKKADAEVPAP